MTVAHRSDRLGDRPIPPHMIRLLRDGNADKPFEITMSLVLSMRQAGWSRARIRSALLDPANAGGAWLRGTKRKYGAGAAGRELADLIARADNFARAHPPVGDRATAVEAALGIRRAADDHVWAGRAGSSDRIVLDALVLLAGRGGGVRFRASQRQLAEETNLSRRTVTASLRRLQAAGWLDCLSRGMEGRGSEWTILSPNARNCTSISPGERMTTGAITLADFTSHDAFARGALPVSFARTLAWLVGGLATPDAKEIAAGLGLAVSTVRVHLRGLESAGLAARGLDGSWSPAAEGPEIFRRLDALARWRRSTGQGDALKARHKTEREDFSDRRAAKQRERLRVIEGGRSARLSNAGVPAGAQRAATCC